MVTALIPWIMLPLRLILGVICIIRGYPKLKVPERAATVFLKIGMPSTKLSAVIIALTEFFGGIALVLGFSTRIIAALLIAELTVVAWRKIKIRKRYHSDYKLDLLLIIISIILLILGSGGLSVDQRFGWRLG